jgi:hypothetical protein
MTTLISSLSVFLVASHLIIDIEPRGAKAVVPATSISERANRSGATYYFGCRPLSLNRASPPIDPSDITEVLVRDLFTLAYLHIFLCNCIVEYKLQHEAHKP